MPPVDTTNSVLVILAQIFSVAFIIWWSVKKKDWATNETEKSKINDQLVTQEQNQSAQSELSSAEDQNARDRAEILNRPK